MKQCPLCKEHFADEQNFCNTDGTPLVEKVRKGPDLNAAAVPPFKKSRANEVWPIVTIGILIGVIICLTAYAVMMTSPAEKDGRNNRGENAKLNPSDRPLPATATRTEPIPAASIPQPSPEASATESATPTPAAPEAS